MQSTPSRVKHSRRISAPVIIWFDFAIVFSFQKLDKNKKGHQPVSPLMAFGKKTSKTNQREPTEWPR
jgi:hypothetical protein